MTTQIGTWRKFDPSGRVRRTAPAVEADLAVDAPDELLFQSVNVQGRGLVQLGSLWMASRALSTRAATVPTNRLPGGVSGAFGCGWVGAIDLAFS
jgi:hypothetical protein